ncbi:hypothetical protein [Lichenihabitans psoromatis]|uniref:hypothetical protein n=1 Tax=Lichenihabitans psoromatis TaxID=2528642 RepID=UPI001036AF78|nr:hypothetical protein [Lichenihabitans psoromatis]
MTGVFRKGLSDVFVGALERQAEQGWWSDVLADKSLLIAIRNEYLNIYWQGQSLFTIRLKGGAVTASTHPKYLVDPALSKQVPFDGETFKIDALLSSGFIQTYMGPATLKKMKTAAGSYSGVEKQGVHVMVSRDLAVVDVEIALTTTGMDEAAIAEADAGNLPRIDIAKFQVGSSGPELVFWEAKDFGNPELRAREGDAPVVAQIAKYQATLNHHHADVVTSYKRVAKNLTQLAAMSKGHRSVAAIISEVADGADLHFDPAAVGLVIFGFDAAQRDDPKWKEHLKKLEKGGKELLRAAGDPKNIRL